MARWITSYPETHSNSHLFPNASAESDSSQFIATGDFTDAEADAIRSRSDDREDTAWVVGPAYCGYDPRDDSNVSYRELDPPTLRVIKQFNVFDPVHPLGFGREEDFRPLKSWNNPCRECVTIEEDELYADREWQRKFRERYPEVFG